MDDRERMIRVKAAIFGPHIWQHIPVPRWFYRAGELWEVRCGGTETGPPETILGGLLYALGDAADRLDYEIARKVQRRRMSRVEQ